jgi:hypothetical protein
MKSISSIVLVFFVVSQIISESRSNELSTQSDILVHAICGEKEYITCLEIDEAECSKVLYKAIEFCPKRAIDSLDIEVVDVPCSMQKFFEYIDISDQQIQRCEAVLKEEKEKTKGHPPNKE